MEILKTFLLNHLIGNNFFIILLSFFFAGMGLCAFIKPTFITKQFDIPTLTDSGKNEVRAVYGGFGIFMATSLIMALIITEIRNGVCLTVAFALGGMSFGRLISIIIDGRVEKLPIFYGTIEFIAAAMLLFY